MRYLRLTAILLAQLTLFTHLSGCGSTASKRTQSETNPPQGSHNASQDSDNSTQTSSHSKEDTDGSKGDSPPQKPEPSKNKLPSPKSENSFSFSIQKDPGLPGPYSVKIYYRDLEDPAYQSAMIFYPEGAKPDQKLPSTTLSGGYSNTKENMTWIGEHLASHGIIVIAFTPTQIFSTNASFWARGHSGAFKKLQKEAERSDSPIQGLIDPKRIGIMGFSMGGAGTLLAVDELQGKAAAAIALCPYQPQAPRASTPILYVTGSNDTTARPGPIIDAYKQTQTGAPKGLENIQGLAHSDIVRTQTFRKKLAEIITAWIGHYVGGVKEMEKFLPKSNG